MIDLIAFSQTTQNNGFDYVAVAAGEDFHAYSGDDLYIQTPGTIRMFAAIGATTNLLKHRFKTKAMADWCSNNEGMSVDDGVRGFHSTLLCGVPVKKGDVLNYQADTANQSEMTQGLVWLSKKATAYITQFPPATLARRGNLDPWIWNSHDGCADMAERQYDI